MKSGQAMMGRWALLKQNAESCAMWAGPSNAQIPGYGTRASLDPSPPCVQVTSDEHQSDGRVLAQHGPSPRLSIPSTAIEPGMMAPAYNPHLGGGGKRMRNSRLSLTI